ncbi:MAG: hypothetical protein KTR31_12845 [Myxococcales bacterium]|nr:hypothetical protein [Myxococcales bacterium]
MPHTGVGNHALCEDLGLTGSSCATYPTRPGDTWVSIARAARGDERELRDANPGLEGELEPLDLVAIPPHWDAGMLPGSGVAPSNDVERFSQLVMHHRGDLKQLPVDLQQLSAQEVAALVAAARHHRGQHEGLAYGGWLAEQQHTEEPTVWAMPPQRLPELTDAPALLPVVDIAETPSAGALLAHAYLKGLWVELQAQWEQTSPQRLQAVGDQLLRAGLVQAVFPPVGVAGAVHGVFAEVYELLRTVLTVDEIFEAVTELVEALFSPQGADVAFALGRDTVASRIDEVESITEMSAAEVAYWLGYQMAPLVADLLLAVLTAGTAAVAARAFKVGADWVLESVDGFADLRRRLDGMDLATLGPDASGIAFEARRGGDAVGGRRTPQRGKPEGRRRTIHRRNPTEPIRERDPAARPRGRPEAIYDEMSEEQKRDIELQHGAAEDLARSGYDVEQSPGVSAERMEAAGLSSAKDPDYLINDEIFDCYSPRSSTPLHSIFMAVRRKVAIRRQTKRVLINLQDSAKRVSAIRDYFRTNSHEDWVAQLDEVLALKNGTVHRIFPP